MGGQSYVMLIGKYVVGNREPVMCHAKQANVLSDERGSVICHVNRQIRSRGREPAIYYAKRVHSFSEERGPIICDGKRDQSYVI